MSEIYRDGSPDLGVILGQVNADDIAATMEGAQVLSFLHGYDGTTWDRIRGTSADGLLVNLGANNDVVVTNAGTFVVQEDGAALTALQLIDNPVFVDDAAFTLTSSSVSIAGAIRDDTLASLVAAEGDAIPLRVNSTGALHVTGGGGTEFTDDTSTHLSGTTAGGILMAAATPTDGSVDANDIGALAMSLDRRLHTDAQIVGTDAALDVSAATVTVDLGANNDVTVTGDALTALQLIDNTVAVLGTATYLEGTTSGNVIGAVRNDVLAALAGVDNEIAPLQVNATGALYIQEGAAMDVSAATVTVDLGANNDVINTGTFAVQVDGAALTALQLIDNTVAVLGTATYSEATTSGNVIGAVRNDTLAALAGTDNEIAPLQVNSRGALYTTGQDASAWRVNHVPAVNVQATVTQAAAGAGVRNVCTAITVSLAAGSTAPTAVNVNVNLRDGASGAGTVAWGQTISLPATAGATNGFVVAPCWIVGTANTAMTIEFSAAGGANTFQSVFAQGITITE